MNILILTTAYDAYCATPLAAELAAELSRNHEVLVLAVNWAASAGSTTTIINRDGYEAIVLTPTGLGKTGKLLFSSFRLARLVYTRGPFDRVITFSPAIALWAPLLIARGRKTLYITDFFPFHHVQLGTIPRIVRKPLALIESFLFRCCDELAVMSGRGKSYLESKYTLSGQPIQVIPLWSGGFAPTSAARNDVRRTYGLPNEASIAVFGGQIERGRGIETIVATAKKLPDVLFLFIGSGSLQHLVTGSENIKHIPAVAREEYLTIASACDLGIVATVTGVDVPTFPSKSVDYAYCGLPIAASVEATSDYRDFIEENGLGHAVIAGNPTDLAGAIVQTLKDKKSDIRATASRVFSVSRAAEQFLRSD